MAEAPPAHQRIQSVGWGLLVALALMLLLPVAQEYEPYSFLHGDGAFYANINRGIVESGSLDQGKLHPRSWIEDSLPWNRNLDQGWSNVSLGADGVTWYPKHPFLMPLAATPFYVAFGMPGLLVFNVFATLLLLFLAFRVATRFVSPVSAALATLLFAASPLFQRSAYSYSNDIFYAALALGGLLALLHDRRRWAGILLGLAVWAKVSNVLFVAPVLVWYGLRMLRRPATDASGRWRPLVELGAALALPLAVFAVANWWMFGAPWTTSYDRILVRQDGVIALESARERFGTPMWQGLRVLVGHGREGLWQNLAVFFVALAGFVPLFRRAWGFALATLVALVAYFLFFAPYEYIYARFFLPWAGLSVVLTAALIDAAARGGPVSDVASGRSWWTRLGRLRWAVVGTLLAVTVVAAVLRGGVGGDPYRLATRAQYARVALGELPCDYFNNSRQKWECAQIEGAPWTFTGAATGGECRFSDEDEPLLRAYPGEKGRTRTIRFVDLPRASGLTLAAGIDPVGRRGAARATVEVFAGDQKLGSVELGGKPALVRQRWDAPSLASGGGTVELRLPPGPRGQTPLCLGVSLEP